MTVPFEQAEQKDKPRDDVEAKRLGSSREASQILESQIRDEQNISKLPKKEQEKAKQVMSEIKSLIGKTDPESLASINNIMRLNSSLLNSIDPTLIRTLNQELRRIAKEKNQEAARNGNIPVLTAGAMEYINQGSTIFAEVGKDLEIRQQKASKET